MGLMSMRSRRLVGLLLLACGCLGGCVPLPPVSPSSAATGVPQAIAGEPAGASRAPVGTLEARRVGRAPRLDGELDATWSDAEPLRIPLAQNDMRMGMHDSPVVELRAVYTADALFLLARWHGARPPEIADTTYNQLTVHWTIPTPRGAAAPACTVACHTAYVDGRGQVAYLHAETIPQGGSDALPAAGGWADGVWSVAWSRPLASGNAYDLQFDDLGVAYTFFVKVFLRATDRPDPVSDPYALVFVR
jgi:hypothetical protein